MLQTNANYLRVGKWAECLHCHTFYVGDRWQDHFCGAPGHPRPPLDGLDGISAEWEAKAAASRIREALRRSGHE